MFQSTLLFFFSLSENLGRYSGCHRDEEKPSPLRGVPLEASKTEVGKPFTGIAISSTPQNPEALVGEKETNPLDTITTVTLRFAYSAEEKRSHKISCRGCSRWFPQCHNKSVTTRMARGHFLREVMENIFRRQVCQTGWVNSISKKLKNKFTHIPLP